MGMSHLATYKVPPYKDLVCVMSDRIFVKPLLTLLMASMFFNLIIIIVLYIFIQRAIFNVFSVNEEKGGFWKQAIKVTFGKKKDKDYDDDAKSPLKRKELKSTLLILLVVTCSVVAFLPSTIHVIVISINKKLFRPQDRLMIYVFLTINSVIDPILYAFNIKNIRHAAKKLMYRIFCCSEVKEERFESTSMTPTVQNSSKSA